MPSSDFFVSPKDLSYLTQSEFERVWEALRIVVRARARENERLNKIASALQHVGKDEDINKKSLADQYAREHVYRPPIVVAPGGNDG